MLTRRLHWALVSGAALLCTKLPPLHCADNNSDNKRTRPASVITAKLPKEPVGLLDRAGQVVVCLSLGLLSKFIMQVLNSTTFVDTEKLVDVLKDDSRQRVSGLVRPRTAVVVSFVLRVQGVLTVCNHVSAVDDPGTIAAMLPLTWFFTPERIRCHARPRARFCCAFLLRCLYYDFMYVFPALSFREERWGALISLR